MKLIALGSVLHLSTLPSSGTVCCSVVPSGSLQRAEAYMIFFGRFQSVINTEGSKFRALVWPMGRILANPAFVIGWPHVVVPVGSNMVDCALVG